jgi:hypothetical protein
MTNGHYDPIASEPFIAGQVVEPGLYRRVGTNIEICMHEKGCLPASLDGRVACYERVCNTWSHHTSRHGDNRKQLLKSM